MQGPISKVIRALVAMLCLVGVRAGAEEDVPSTAIVVSVAEQKLVILRDGGWIAKFPVSTSKFGLGDSYGSYKTPLGRLRVCEKIGDDLTPGAVIKQRHATGEVLPANSPGRDPIVTRILWLDGLEPQNVNARSRGIYIHGTVEESKIGEAVSYGCIRMRSKDVLEVFDAVPLDAPVTIIAEKFPRYPKYAPPKAPVIVAAPPAPKLVAKAGPVPAATPPLPSPAPGTLAAKKAIPTGPSPVAMGPTRQTLDRPSTSTSVSPISTTGASLALRGSMLDAGLPEGPKIPVLPPPPEPKDVPRFSTLTPGLPEDSAFSLQGISRDLSPAIRAADTDAAMREASAAKEEATAKEEQEAPAESSKPASRIAFRADGTVEKIKR